MGNQESFSKSRIFLLTMARVLHFFSHRVMLYCMLNTVTLCGTWERGQNHIFFFRGCSVCHTVKLLALLVFLSVFILFLVGMVCFGLELISRICPLLCSVDLTLRFGLSWISASFQNLQWGLSPLPRLVLQCHPELHALWCHHLALSLQEVISIKS